MKTYTVKTQALYSDTVEVEADSAEEAMQLAHKHADYDFDYWYFAKIENVSDEEL